LPSFPSSFLYFEWPTTLQRKIEIGWKEGKIMQPLAEAEPLAPLSDQDSTSLRYEIDLFFS
jgi:hypothetical protein